MDTDRNGSRRFVVTGVGRSGTAFTADVLNHAGVRTGHEEVFQAFSGDARWRMCPDTVERGCPQGDVSMFAAPYIEHLPAGTVVVHQVRDPVRWAQSWASNLRRGHTYRFVRAYIPELPPAAERAQTPQALAQRLCVIWTQWNHLVERLAQERELPYTRHRVEDLDARRVAELCEMFGRPISRRRAQLALERVPRDRNTRRPPKAAIDVRVLSLAPAFPPFAAMAERYGYTVAP